MSTDLRNNPRSCPMCDSNMLFVAISRQTGEKICFECKAREDKQT